MQGENREEEKMYWKIDIQRCGSQGIISFKILNIITLHPLGKLTVDFSLHMVERA